MRHQHSDVNANVKLDIPVEDIEQVIDKITDAALVIIAASTVAYIFKQCFKKETP